MLRSHVATDEQKEKELRFSMWGTYTRVLQHGRVLEGPHETSATAGATSVTTNPQCCLICPFLRKSEKDPLVLPQIIEAAGGKLLEDPGGKVAAAPSTMAPVEASKPLGRKRAAGAATAFKVDLEGCLVLGVAEDKLWAKRSLPSGIAVYPRTVLIHGVIRGQLDLSSPLFVV